MEAEDWGDFFEDDEDLGVVEELCCLEDIFSDDASACLHCESVEFGDGGVA